MSYLIVTAKLLWFNFFFLVNMCYVFFQKYVRKCFGIKTHVPKQWTPDETSIDIVKYAYLLNKLTIKYYMIPHLIPLNFILVLIKLYAFLDIDIGYFFSIFS